MSEWKETVIGLLPNDWDLKTVDEIKAPEKKSIISGPFGSNISAKYFVSNGIPVIRLILLLRCYEYLSFYGTKEKTTTTRCII